MYYNYSQYNIILKEQKEFVFLYNSFSGALCMLEKDIHHLIEHTTLDDNNKCPNFDELLKQGFIKPVEMDEYEKIRIAEQTYAQSADRKTLFYVIAPTTACNLNCQYCFEKGSRNRAPNKGDIFAIADYIAHRTFPETKRISVRWFGGEPLLAYDKIVQFSQYLMPKLHDKNIDYSSTMITNGILLTEERASVLSEQCAVRHIQITVDGTKDVYCAQKRATERQFDQLLQNIRAAVQHVKVSVRLNCDKNNYADLKPVAKQLVDYCNNSANLHFYLAKIVNYGNAPKNNFLSQEEFDYKRIEFDKYICNLQNRPYDPPLPRYHKTFCELFNSKNQVIGPDGEIYKCEHHVGQADKVIGNIDLGINNHEFLTNFLANQPQEKCRTCKIFPLCLGGCPAEKIDLPQEEHCRYSEHYLRHLLDKYCK